MRETFVISIGGIIMADPLDEFVEFDAMIGADAVKCPHCGAVVGKSLLFDDEVVCPDCGKTIKGG
jgi:DNA-directed RNA polymerase subunit RPC12/RpoP